MTELIIADKPTFFSEIDMNKRKEETALYDPIKNIIDRHGVLDYYTLNEEEKEIYWDARAYGNFIRLAAKFTKGWTVRDVVNSKKGQCSEYRLSYVEPIIHPLSIILARKQKANPEKYIHPAICVNGFTLIELRVIITNANYVFEDPSYI